MLNIKPFDSKVIHGCNTCPKCRMGLEPKIKLEILSCPGCPSIFNISIVEVLKVRCSTCGYLFGHYHPADHKPDPA